MSTINVAPSARIYVLISPQSNQAIIIRTGPAEHNLTIGWNLRSDKFTQGQWLKGKIYIEKCDISPDGQHWVYFAYKHHAYTVIARTPYLRALHYFENETTYGGGGYFHDDQNISLYVYPIEAKDIQSKNFIINKQPFNDNPLHNIPILAAHLKKNEWNCLSLKPWDEGSIFQKNIDLQWQFTMTKIPYDSVRSDGGKKYFAYTLEHLPSHSIITTDDWDWADYDAFNNRMIWAEFGKIMSGKLRVSKTNADLADIKCLLNMNDMVFEPLTAPY